MDLDLSDAGRSPPLLLLFGLCNFVSTFCLYQVPTC